MARNNRDESRKAALITGGSSFLGAAISRKFAQEGFDLVLHYQNSRQRTQKLAAELRQLGSEVVLVQADLRKPGQASQLIKKVGQSLRRLDHLINNASLFLPTPFSSPRVDPWPELFNVNLFSPYFLSQAAFPWLNKRRGSIVNLTDIYGENPILRDYPAYCASKSAFINLTKYLAREMSPSVRVNGVSPGAIFIPKNYSRKQRDDLVKRSLLRRQGKSEDIAEAVFFLATQSFITGQVLKVDGGRFI